MAETNGMNGQAASKALDWRVGLFNPVTGKYLTAESFGSFNITGTSLKKKQIWTLENDRDEENTIYIRSYLDKRISTNAKDGEIHTEKEGEDERFSVEYGTGVHSGQWLFKHKVTNAYLGANSKNKENVLCKNMQPAECDYWTVELSIHPQINLRNVNRKRYVHLENDQLQCTEVEPWGTDALITLECSKGEYAFKTSDNRYLQNDGVLMPGKTKECVFFLEMNSGKDCGLAFKDCNQCYLTAVGSGTVKTLRKTKTKDDYFTIEDSHPQVYIISNKGKKASIKQGQDVSAYQEEEGEDTETFQIEYQKDNQWAVLGCKGKYWSLAKGSGSGIQAAPSTVKDECLFDLEWQGDGTVGIKACNSKYVSHTGTGTLIAVADALTEKEKFKITIINRPLLVLKCKHGFVGKHPKTEEYACNKASYDIFHLEANAEGKYSLKDSSGKYWKVNQGIIVRDDAPSYFVIEFRKKSHLSIKDENGCFLQGKQNGQIVAKTTDLYSDETGNDVSLWEF